MSDRKRLTLSLWLMVLLTLTLTACQGRAAQATNTPQASAPTPSITVAPVSGKPGTPIAVTGSGWNPGDNVIISLQNPTAKDQAAVQVAAAIVDADGHFSAAFVLPVEAPWIDLPRVSIRAHALAAGATASIEFEIDRETVTPTSIAIVTPTPPATDTPTPVGCTDRATFVGDVTIPDQTNLAPGAAFIKTWRLRNDGTCTWDTRYALAFAKGEQLGGPAAAALPGPVAPGSTIDVSVGLSAPASNGVYRGYWQLRNDAGKTFGIGSDGQQSFWVHIVVGPTPTPVPIAAWRGEYFANRDLAGAPVLVRDDADVNFDWRTVAPAPQLSADDFSARWTRSLNFNGGVYRFHVRSDDGVRVWLNNELIIDQWHAAANTTYSIDRTLGSGPSALRVEYYENKGDARVQFWWERAGDFPQWRGDYFANISLSGAAAVVRNDTDINFNWGSGAPATGLPVDNFSARWSRTLWFDEGSYRFRVLSDDGFRLYLDGALYLDDWRDGNARNTSVTVWLPAGNHAVRLEYYERAGNALVQLWWEKVSGNYPDWKGEYWSNRDLSGGPIVIRNDRALSFDWGNGAPDAGIPADNFSARWSRTLQFEPGRYRFTVRADDGVRVTIDGNRIIDGWHLNDGRSTYQAEVRLTGASQVVVEYFEASAGARLDVSWARVATSPTSTFTPTKIPSATPTATATTTRTPSATPTATPTSVAQPGMLIQGRVTMHDVNPSGVANVKIYRSFASYPGVVVATTDQDGYYATAFQPIPGDEQVTVWAEREGYMFEPLQYSWRHTFGYKAYRLDFSAKPEAATATSTPTATDMPPTSTATATPTAIIEPPTATSTATSVPPTPTSTATLEPERERVVLSEIMPAPQSVDWNNDGVIDTRDEWIEVVNLDEGAIDLSGWLLDINGPANYVIPIGTILQPREYAVFYGGQTGLTLPDDAGQMRLKDAQGRMIDRVQYDAVSPDGSYSRDDTGNWHSDWPPSPGAPNGQPGNIIAQAKQPSAEAPEAALRATLEQLVAAIRNLLDSLFR